MFNDDYLSAKKYIGLVKDPRELRELAEYCIGLATAVERSEWSVGDFCLINFKTRGLKLGVLVKKNPKKFNVLVLAEYPPRQSRRWRVDSSVLHQRVAIEDLKNDDGTYEFELALLADMHNDHRRAWFEEANWDIRQLLQDLGRI